MTKDPRLSKMWDLLVDDFVDRLENGEDKVSNEGEVVKVKPTAATLSVIAKFVKDHQISNPKSDKPNALAALLADARGEMDEDYPS